MPFNGHLCLKCLLICMHVGSCHISRIINGTFIMESPKKSRRVQGTSRYVYVHFIYKSLLQKCSGQDRQHYRPNYSNLYIYIYVYNPLHWPTVIGLSSRHVEMSYGVINVHLLYSKGNS